MQITSPGKPVGGTALLHLGFRPFFLLASLFAVIAMLLWMGMYFLPDWSLVVALPGVIWHGHEMLFGYGMAVVAGFLLTAVRNWTNIQTLNGTPLLLLALLWLVARILPFTGLEAALWLMAFFDLAFGVYLLLAITQPVIRTKQWGQVSILAKVALLVVANLLFYLGVLGVMTAQAIQWGLLLGLYGLIALILVMGRRVMPFFIERGLNGSVELRNWKWLDISSLVLFLLFVIADVFFTGENVVAVLAGLLFALHSLRLLNWHAIGLWRKPLLWVLYLGYGFIVLGFGLKMLAGWLPVSPWLSLHAFAAGGIGIVTAGMMSRVSLGHTGRNVFEPPAILQAIFVLLLIAACIRVIAPLILPQLYNSVIFFSQLFWILGFGLFAAVYVPVLIKPRLDGQYG